MSNVSKISSLSMTCGFTTQSKIRDPYIMSYSTCSRDEKASKARLILSTCHLFICIDFFLKSTVVHGVFVILHDYTTISCKEFENPEFWGKYENLITPGFSLSTFISTQ